MVDEVFAVRTHGFIIYLHKDGINFLVTLSQLKKKEITALFGFFKIYE